MAEASIIEFLVYSLIAYGSILMLIISVIKKDVPSDNSQGLTRVAWFIPGLVCAALLQGIGPKINMPSSGVEFHEVYNSTGALITNTTINQIIPSQITIVEPTWIMVNFMVFITLFLFIFIQAVNVLTKRD